MTWRVVSSVVIAESEFLAQAPSDRKA